MFDLDRAIAAWRERMLSGDAVTSSSADEMEDHLRCAVADLTKPGLSGEEAFLVAARRLGGPSELEAEHVKLVDPVRRRETRWLLAGVVLAALLPAAARFVVNAISFVAVQSGARPGSVTYLVAAVVFAGLVFLLARLGRSAARADGAFSRLIDKRMIGAAAVALGLLITFRVADIVIARGMVNIFAGNQPTIDAYHRLSVVGGLIGMGLPVAALVLLAWPRRPADARASNG